MVYFESEIVKVDGISEPKKEIKVSDEPIVESERSERRAEREIVENIDRSPIISQPNEIKPVKLIKKESERRAKRERILSPQPKKHIDIGKVINFTGIGLVGYLLFC